MNKRRHLCLQVKHCAAFDKEVNDKAFCDKRLSKYSRKILCFCSFVFIPYNVLTVL